MEFWRGVLTHLDSADHSHLIGEFVQRTLVLDRLRGESTASAFPELAAVFDAAPPHETVSSSSGRRGCSESSS